MDGTDELKSTKLIHTIIQAVIEDLSKTEKGYLDIAT